MLFDTLQEMDRLRSALFSAMDETPTVAAPMNLIREGDRYVLDADLPGVAPKSIDVAVDGRWLTIRAERSTTSEHTKGEWLVRERSNAAVLRRVTLGHDVDVDHIEATYHDGVLTVTIPVAETARPRRIAVGTGTPAQPQLSQATPERAAETAGEGKAEPAHSLAN